MLQTRNGKRTGPAAVTMQKKDFAGLFEAMDGFPVVIRTLDPPLHEFVPKREELRISPGCLMSISRPSGRWWRATRTSGRTWRI